MGGGFGFGTSSSSNKSSQQSGTQFPWEFLSGVQNTIGAPFNQQQIAAMMPQTRGLFDSTPYGFGATGAQGQTMAGQAAPGTAGEVAGNVAGQPATPTVATAAKPYQFSVADFPNGGGKYFVPTLQRYGINPNSFTLEDIDKAGMALTPANRAMMIQRSQVTAAQQAPPQYGFNAPPQSAEFAGGQNPNQALATLGIGGPAPTYQSAYTPLAGGDYNRLESALYASNALPQLTELERQRGIQQNEMQAKLAGAGLASSGTGLGQLTRANREFQQRASDVSRQAAEQATTQRYGLESQEKQFAATDVGRAQALSQQALTAAQDSMLKTLGLQEQDLQRLDARDQGLVKTMVDAYAQMLDLISGAGRYSTGQSKGSSSSLNVYGSGEK